MKSFEWWRKKKRRVRKKYALFGGYYYSPKEWKALNRMFERDRREWDKENGSD